MPTRICSLIAVLVTAVLLGACAGLPTSDTVREGQPIVGQPPQNVQVLPAAPEADASPTQVVSGFLRANVGFRDDHDTAQAFLTSELSDQWRPTSSVVIYDGDVRAETIDPGQVEVRVDLRGSLDQNGRLEEAIEGTEWRGTFDLEQTDGQWRIASFPDEFGLLLSTNEFAGQYTQRPITYLSPVRAEYVFDRRWFPNYSQGGLPTALARAQLQQPPDYLRGGVDHGFPNRTELAGPGVPVDPGTFLATIELAGSSTSATDEQMTWMWVQMANTLTSASGVSRVSLQSAGYPMDVAGIDESLGDPVELGYSETDLRASYALLRTRDGLQPVRPEHYALAEYTFGADEAEPHLPAIALPFIDLATDAEVTEFAAVSYDRTHLARWHGPEGEEIVMRAIGTGLTAPSFDRSGGLWVAGRAATGPRVWWIDRSSAPSQAVAQSISADWMLDSWEVGAFRMAPDDVRAVIHIRDQGGGNDRLGIVSVIRDESNRPVSITEPMWIASTVTGVRSVAWESPDDLLILGQRAQDNADIPYRYPIGGWLEPLDQVDLARGIRAGTDVNGQEIRIVLNQQGNIFTPEGQTGWETYVNGDEIAIPGY